jgi:hypothetical protein
VECATAIALPEGEKATPLPVSEGSVAGFVYLVPKPEEDQGYAVTKGVVLCATAISLPEGLKATPLPVLAGNVAGFAYLVPKPEDQGYAEIKGEVECATAMNPGTFNELAIIPIMGILDYIANN